MVTTGRPLSPACREEARYPARAGGLLPVVIAALLIGLGVYALRLGAADLLTLPARTALEQPLGRDRGADEGRWNAIAGALRAARRLDPLNPAILADLGRALEASVAPPRPWDDHARQRVEQALKNYRRAAALRPSWPYTWVNIAQTKLSLAEIDQEFARALGRAAELGPWEPEVQLAVAELGLATWHLLPTETRRTVIVSAKKGLQLQPERLIRTAFDLDRQELLRPLGQSQPAAAELFRKEQAHRGAILRGHDQAASGGGA
jgi:tetratricopeptide (TPR) repeat protein